MTQKPSFRFSLTLPGQIWQTALDEVNAFWVLEIRDADVQTIRYQVVDLQTGHGEELSEIQEADWWTVVLRFFFPILILERYNDPQNPTDKDLILYDVKKKQVIATLDDFQFEMLQGHSILGCNPANPGEKKIYNLSGAYDFVKKKLPTIGYPVYFAPASENMKLVNAFLEKEPSAVGCEYFETKNCIIISYYVRLDRKFDRKLLVLQGDDELYHGIQDVGLTGYASGAFFVFGNLVVFIKNGNQINGLEI